MFECGIKYIIFFFSYVYDNGIVFRSVSVLCVLRVEYGDVYEFVIVVRCLVIGCIVIGEFGIGFFCVKLCCC